MAEICRVLGWCESTYYAFNRRCPRTEHCGTTGSKRDPPGVEANYGVYGYRKVHAHLGREDFAVAE